MFFLEKPWEFSLGRTKPFLAAKLLERVLLIISEDFWHSGHSALDFIVTSPSQRNAQQDLKWKNNCSHISEENIQTWRNTVMKPAGLLCLDVGLCIQDRERAYITMCVLHYYMFYFRGQFSVPVLFLMCVTL